MSRPQHDEYEVDLPPTVASQKEEKGRLNTSLRKMLYDRKILFVASKLTFFIEPVVHTISINLKTNKTPNEIVYCRMHFCYTHTLTNCKTN